MKLKLHRLNLGEASELLDESLNAFLPVAKRPNETSKELIKRFRSDPKFEIFGFKIDNKPISYITALSYQSDDSISIGPMYVSEKYRRQGLGKMQLLDLINLYRAKGYHQFFTKTWSSNIASIKSIEHCGFKLTDIKENDRINGDSTVSYLLEIKYINYVC